LKSEIVPATGDYAGAELEELVTRAKRNAFERDAEAVEKEDFERSLESFLIDREEREKLHLN
jgi:ATP-dependent 26S proteasome regulatory subunit